jgi:hypothetical protein
VTDIGSWAKSRLLPRSQQHDDYANVIAAQVIDGCLHLTDLECGPLPRRARTCRGLLEVGTRGMSGFRGARAVCRSTGMLLTIGSPSTPHEGKVVPVSEVGGLHHRYGQRGA